MLIFEGSSENIHKYCLLQLREKQKSIAKIGVYPWHSFLMLRPMKSGVIGIYFEKLIFVRVITDKTMSGELNMP